LGRSGQTNSPRDRKSGGKGGKGGRGEANSPAGAGKNDAVDRPGASGHRFGPDLACSECGILWDVHQRDPKPCQTQAMRDAFARRPSGDFDGNSAAAAPTTTTATTAAKTPKTAETAPEDD